MDVTPKAFATGDKRCPVKLFTEFINHRPDSMKTEESPLFLAIRRNIVDYKREFIWYLGKPLGKNSIGNFLCNAKQILEDAGLLVSQKGKLTNHSARKTTITNLMHENINPLHIYNS